MLVHPSKYRVIIIVSFAVFLILITTALFSYYHWGKYQIVYNFCICGYQHDVYKVFDKTVYHRTFKGNYKNPGIPPINEHVHHWNFLCSINQDWGGDVMTADGFGVQFHIFYQIDKYVENNQMNKITGEKYKEVLIDDELKNMGRNRVSIIKEIEDLIRD